MTIESKEKLNFLLRKNYRLIINKNFLCFERKDNELDCYIVRRNLKSTWKRDIENFIIEAWNLVHYNKNGCLNNLLHKEYEFNMQFLHNRL